MLGVRHHGREPQVEPRNQRVQYSTILAYRTDAFKGRKAPVPWKDLLDLKGGL